MESIPGANFFTAFTEPMTLTGTVKIASNYTSEYIFNAIMGVKISTDGKFLAMGKLNFFGDSISISAKLYLNISKIAQGSATVLFLADAPDQLPLLTILAA